MNHLLLFKKLALVIAAALAFSIVGFAPALAQEPTTPSAKEAPANAAPEKTGEEDETAQFKHSASVRWIAKKTALSLDHAYWVVVVVNFVLVVCLIPVIIKLLLGSNLATVFRNRTNFIQKSLEEARKASEDAGRRISEIESRLGRRDEEIAGMKAHS